MIHPFFHLLVTQPNLIADHADAYAELVSAEIGTVSAAYKRKALLNAVQLCCLVVAAVLAGVAAMLWVVIPDVRMHALWTLLCIPLLPIAAALWCRVALRELGDGPPFAKVLLQLKADIAMLREASSP